jgi:hypothetical protein
MNKILRVYFDELSLVLYKVDPSTINPPEKNSRASALTISFYDLIIREREMRCASRLRGLMHQHTRTAPSEPTINEVVAEKLYDVQDITDSSLAWLVEVPAHCPERELRED